MVKWKGKRSELSLVLVLIAAAVISARVPIEHASDPLGDLIDPFADDPSRLPLNVIPVHYDLKLTAMTGSKFSAVRSYSGSVRIHIKIFETGNSITLHSRGLTVAKIKLTGLEGGSEIATTYTFTTNYDFLTINTGSTSLSQGQDFSLEIDFTGNMRVDMGGFYRSSYRADNETVSRYIT